MTIFRNRIRVALGGVGVALSAALTVAILPTAGLGQSTTAASPTSLSGVWSGGGITLTLRRESGTSRYLGTLRQSATVTAVELAPSGTSWKGTETVGATRRPLTLTRTPTGLRLDRNGAVVALRRTGDLTDQRVTLPLPDDGTITGGAAAPLFGSIEFPGFPGGGGIGGGGNGGGIGGGGNGGGIGGGGNGGTTAEVFPDAPPFLVPGMRLTYRLGTGSSPGARPATTTTIGTNPTTSEPYVGPPARRATSRSRCSAWTTASRPPSCAASPSTTRPAPCGPPGPTPWRCP